jgi:glycosyltransferase involved in cell wall biosynthesis
MPRPSVTVILPVLDEADHIDEVMSDLLGQDYNGPLEVIVADGGSSDGTSEKLQAWVERDDRVKLIDNPEVRQAYGLNRAAAEAVGEVLVRADGHTRFAPDYVRTSAQVLEEVGGAVGGRMSPLGRTPFGQAVAAAMESPLTMGPGRFHHATKREEVDTVYLGAFRREDFDASGGFRAFPSGSSEDADFYYRWRKSGRKIHVDPWIVSSYTPRDTPAALWGQYFRYGMGKAEMLWVNGELPSWRPLAPLALVLGLILFTVAGLLTGRWVALSVLAGLWLLTLGWVALRAEAPALGVFRAAGIMHLAYGIGMIWGLVRGPGRIRSLKPR